MEQSEVETLVEELELRVERLRALYDQYFMGIEKLEPAVPRKDVDRRLFVLRRIQIRNTSLRFRFQNVLLRFNTYQTYWMRICRQIEEGTYKRDVRRANARFSAKGRREEAAREPKEEAAPDTEPPSPKNVLDELEELAGEAIDVDFDTGDDGSSSDWLEELQMKAVLRPAGLPKDRLPPRQAEPEAAPETQKPAHNLEIPTEREIWIGKKPNQDAAAAPPAQAGTRRSSRPASSRPPALPLVLPTAKSPPAKPLPPNPPPQAAGPVGGVRYAQAGKRTASETPLVAAPTARAAAKPAPAPVPAPEAPATARTGQAPAPGAPRGSSPPKRKSRPSFAKIDLAKAPRAAAPSPAVSKPKDGHLSDERVRQIYTQYVDTKRSLKESTASLTYESLSKSLRDSSDMLRKKHAGKSVDFEVTVKDGKTVLRPVVK